ncbi:hypothetical protein SYNPS1DRAFT_28554, partial [Syncephalis pseudoplumigaleata]
IAGIKEFIETDDYIGRAKQSPVDEDLIAHAQLHHAVVDRTSPVVTLRQLGVLREWLDTRKGAAVASAQKLVSAIAASLQGVIRKDEPEDSLVALADLYTQMEPFYAGNSVDIWSMDEFVHFLGLPPSDGDAHIAKLVQVGEQMLRARDLGKDKLHWLDVYARGVGIATGNRDVLATSDQIHVASMQHLSGDALAERLTGWIASWKQQLARKH